MYDVWVNEEEYERRKRMYTEEGRQEIRDLIESIREYNRIRENKRKIEEMKKNIEIPDLGKLKELLKEGNFVFATGLDLYLEKNSNQLGDWKKDKLTVAVYQPFTYTQYYSSGTIITGPLGECWISSQRYEDKDLESLGVSKENQGVLPAFPAYIMKRILNGDDSLRKYIKDRLGKLKEEDNISGDDVALIRNILLTIFEIEKAREITELLLNYKKENSESLEKLLREHLKDKEIVINNKIIKSPEEFIITLAYTDIFNEKELLSRFVYKKNLKENKS